MQDQLHELQRVLNTEIPLTRSIRLKVVSYNERSISLSAPLAENINHFGTAFAGSLNTVVTLSGWSMLWLLMKEMGLEGNIVIQDSACKYLIPVTKDFAAYCYRPHILLIQSFKQTLVRRGKARLELRAEIVEENSVAVSFHGRYVVHLKQTTETEIR